MSNKKHLINRNRPTGIKLDENYLKAYYKNLFRPIRIGLLGDRGVGKTAICYPLAGLEYYVYLKTFGSDKYEKKVTLNDGKEIKLVIFDTPGRERLRSAALKCIRNVEGVIFVFDITNRNSFDYLKIWLKDMKDNFPKEPTIILFANKIDEDKEKWKVSIEEIETVAKEYNWDYFKISAKNGIGIDEGFNCIAKKIYNKRIKDN